LGFKVRDGNNPPLAWGIGLIFSFSMDRMIDHGKPALMSVLGANRSAMPRYKKFTAFAF